MSQKESRLNLEIASDSKKLAHATERESKSMKGISLLGTIFLPGTFLAVGNMLELLILLLYA